MGPMSGLFVVLFLASIPALPIIGLVIGIGVPVLLFSRGASWWDWHPRY